MFTGELLRQAERYTQEGLHPRLVTEGYEIAKDMVLEFLESYKISKPNIFSDRELLNHVARSSLRTKLSIECADKNQKSWYTIGVSENIIEASFRALLDSFEYKLMKENTAPLN